MDILDVVLGRVPSLDEAEEELGRPEEAEAHDLPLHVSRCAKRWALSYRLSRGNSNQLSQMRLLVIILIIAVALTNPKVLSLLGL